MTLKRKLATSTLAFARSTAGQRSSRLAFGVADALDCNGREPNAAFEHLKDGLRALQNHDRIDRQAGPHELTAKPTQTLRGGGSLHEEAHFLTVR